jgi:hypothetical protein
MTIAINTSATATQTKAVEARLKALAKELDGKRWKATISLPTGEERKLTWLNEGTSRQPARPILSVNAFARARMIAAVQSKFRESMLASNTPSMLAVMTVGAYELRRVWIDRFNASGGDVSLAPLSLRWLTTKRRRGWDSRIGRATGALAAAMGRGQMIVSKVR